MSSWRHVTMDSFMFSSGKTGFCWKKMYYFHSNVFTQCCLLCCALTSTQKLKSRAFNQPFQSQNSHKLRISLTKGGYRHPGGCMAAVSSSFLFSFGLVARGRSFTHHLLLVQTVIQVVCVWICFTSQHYYCPESTFPRCSLSSCSSRHQFSNEVCCQKKQQSYTVLQFGVKGWVLFISWMDLLRKGIPLEAKGTLTDGWAR